MAEKHLHIFILWDNQQINDHWVGLSVNEKYIKHPHPQDIDSYFVKTAWLF